jgi:hypothetical protein
MHVRQAKEFLVQQTAEQAAMDGVALSDLEKRMMYFTETGECPEDPIALNDAFEAEYDTPAYEKKISLLMARAYRRIKRESPEKLRLWNDAFRVLSKGDHYILLFWRQNAFGRSPRMWSTYIVIAIAIAGMYSLLFFFFGFGHRGRFGDSAPVQAPADRYMQALSPWAQHTLQLLFVLALLFAGFPQLLSRPAGALRSYFQSAAWARRRK